MSELKLAGEKLVEWMNNAPVGSKISRHNPWIEVHWQKQSDGDWHFTGANGCSGVFPASFWILSSGFWYCFPKFQVEEELE